MKINIENLEDMYLLEIRKKFEQSLRLLIESNLALRKIYSPDISESEKKFFNEWATINFKSCRRSGHTQSAIKVCSEIFDKVLYLSFNGEQADTYKRINYNLKNVDFFSHRSAGYRGHQYNCIIIDTYSVLKDKDKQEIDRVISPLVYIDNFTVVRLQ